MQSRASIDSRLTPRGHFHTARQIAAALLLAGALALTLAAAPVRAAEPLSLTWETSASVRISRDLPYREAGSTTDSYALTRDKLDLIVPAQAAKPFPLLVWFHGGGLTSGGKEDGVTQAVARRFAEHGVGMALVNYRLSPQATFPAYVEDAAAAVAWCANHAEQIGAAPRAIFVGGHSAGGYLSSLLAMDAHYLGAAGLAPGRIAGFIPMSGQTMTHFTVRKERGLPETAMVADDAAPLYHLRKDSAPILLLMGDDDWPARLEENQYFAAALKKVAGNPAVALQVIPHRDHGSIMVKCLEPGDPAGQAMLSFIKRFSTQPRH